MASTKFDEWKREARRRVRRAARAAGVEEAIDHPDVRALREAAGIAANQLKQEAQAAVRLVRAQWGVGVSDDTADLKRQFANRMLERKRDDGH